MKQTESILEKSSNHRGTTAEHSKRFAFEYTQGGSFGRTGGDISHISRDNGMARQEIRAKQQELAEINLELERTPLENRILRMVEFHERGQESLFHRSEERQESGSVHNNGQGQGTENREIGNQNDQRLYESLQRHLELVREAVERAKRHQSITERADRSLEQSESRIKESERAIDQSQQCYNASKRGIEESQQRIEEK